MRFLKWLLALGLAWLAAGFAHAGEAPESPETVMAEAAANCTRMLNAADQRTALYRREGRTPQAEALAQRTAALHREDDAKK